MDPFFSAQPGNGNLPSQFLQNDPDLVLSGESSARLLANLSGNV